MRFIANHADQIFSIGSLIFTLSLIPSVWSEHKPSFWTSFLTGSVLALFGVTYLAMYLYWSAGVTFITSALWYTLAIQKYHEHSSLSRMQKYRRLATSKDPEPYESGSDLQGASESLG